MFFFFFPKVFTFFCSIEIEKARKKQQVYYEKKNEKYKSLIFFIPTLQIACFFVVLKIPT